MKPALIALEWNGTTLHADVSEGYCIAIPLDHTTDQPNAYYAPLYEATPVKVGTWIGDTREGGSVNFYNLRINPHGNGTHTECMGHISLQRFSIHHALGPGYFVAQLISVYPNQKENGDRIIEQLTWEPGVEAIIIRTMPNHPDKKTRQYSGTNPPYLDSKLVDKMAEDGVQHLLLDLPSVDREEDGGALAAHKAFWKYPENPRINATITELIYVDNVVPDGLYLLQIQIAALELDASPSRPFIYPLK
ncbi:MAG TPA: cyclase family protein [Saprospiraceae bacterium]|nr:cyclase family protein [Saprospiraceae bacterium]